MSAKHDHNSERNPIPRVGHDARSLSVKGFTIKQFRKRIKNSGIDLVRTITVFQPRANRFAPAGGATDSSVVSVGELVLLLEFGDNLLKLGIKLHDLIGRCD